MRNTTLAISLLALSLVSSRSFAQSPIHGHYLFLNSELNYYLPASSTANYDAVTTKTLSGKKIGLDHSITAHLPFGAPGQSSQGSTISQVGVKVTVKWVPDPGETGHPVGEDAGWNISQYRYAHQGISVTPTGTGHVTFMGLVSAQDPANTSFNWSWSKGNNTYLPTIDTTTTPSGPWVEGGFTFALINGEWIGTGNFDITISFSYDLSISSSWGGQLEGRLIKNMELIEVGGLPVT
jgi:hypothetical protein